MTQPPKDRLEALDIWAEYMGQRALSTEKILALFEKQQAEIARLRTDAQRWQFVRDKGLVWLEPPFEGCAEGRIGGDYAEHYVDRQLGYTTTHDHCFVHGIRHDRNCAHLRGPALSLARWPCDCGAVKPARARVGP